MGVCAVSGSLRGGRTDGNEGAEWRLEMRTLTGVHSPRKGRTASAPDHHSPHTATRREGMWQPRLPPGPPFTKMRVAMAKILRPGDSYDFHRIQRKYMDGDTLVFEVEGGWTIRVGEGTTMDRPEEARHQRSCTQRFVEESRIINGTWCPECRRHQPAGYHGDFIPTRSETIGASALAIASSVNGQRRSPRSAPGSYIRTIPREKRLGRALV